MSRGRDDDSREESGRDHDSPRRSRPFARPPSPPKSRHEDDSRVALPGIRAASQSTDSRGRGGSSKPTPSPSNRRVDRDDRRQSRLGDRRDRVGDSRRPYMLRRSEFETLEEIGRFRVVTEPDLQQFRYKGDDTRLKQDLRSLAEQGLVERRQIPLDRTGGRVPMVALTRNSKRLLDKESTLGGEEMQEFHAGFVKPAELAHDAALYQVYQAESERIENAGGRIERVVLDYELKAKLYGELDGRGKDQDADFRERQAEAAGRHHLRVIEGRIPLPDLRIEYRTAGGDAARTDIELTTEHYKSGQIAAKQQAGFQMYSLAGSGSNAGSPVRDDREITAGILSV